MSPAMIFVVPAVTAVMLALASGVAYRQTGRRYLLWWTGIWLVNLAYYIAVMLSVLFGQSQTDLFTQLGLLTTLLGWLRGAGLWTGARVLAGRRSACSSSCSRPPSPPHSSRWLSARRSASRPPAPSPD